MYERLVLIRELMKDNSLIFLHCDWHVNHLIRAVLDELFGKDGFVNECVWKRTTAHGDAKQGAKRFDIVHDTVLVYAKGSDFRWNTQYVPFGEDQIQEQYNKVDEKGRRYRLVTPTAAKPGGDTSYEFHGVTPPPGRYWAYTKDKMEEFYAAGKLYFSGPGQPYLKYYLDERPGVAASTMWTEIPILSPTAKERVDYPTQKPEALLERIIRVSTNPSDLVFDCFMGSGTTQAVAARLGRRFVGADINLGAVQTTTKRLLNVSKELLPKQGQKELGVTEVPKPSFYTGFSVYNVNHYDVFRNPAQAKDLLAEALEIQPLPSNTLYDGEKDGRMVKIMPINRIATKADLNGLLTGFDYKVFQKRNEQAPNKPVESILLVCMGHEPDLAAHLERECQGFKLDVEVVDILRDKAKLEFRRDSQAEVRIDNGVLKITAFYPMNLLQKLSLMKENVESWRELTESVMIDWNYDGAVLEPKLVDVPGKDDLVKGEYAVPPDAGTIRIKITDLLSESLEMEVVNG